jgi:CheY-like chemotaxis protein
MSAIDLASGYQVPESQKTVPSFTSYKPFDDTVASQVRAKTLEGEWADRPTILVVDDERLIADTLGEILDGAGYAVTIAYDGRDALELASNLKPDYLLSDVVMPRMNGVDLAIAIHEVHPATKILLFSGNVGVSAIMEQGRKQGYEFRVLGKPVHPTALLKGLTELE